MTAFSAFSAINLDSSFRPMIAFTNSSEETLLSLLSSISEKILASRACPATHGSLDPCREKRVLRRISISS